MRRALTTRSRMVAEFSPEEVVDEKSRNEYLLVLVLSCSWVQRGEISFIRVTSRLYLYELDVVMPPGAIFDPGA
jgi:hypothetical protein